jgi:phage tail sheath protein FI
MAGYDGSEEAKKRIKAVQTSMIDHCTKARYRFAILDTPPGLTAQQAKEWYGFLNLDTSYAGLYYPWIEVPDLLTGGSKLVPPSGHIAGIYNRSDSERGVHKAPANEVVLNATNLEFNLSRGEQDMLNPLGVNCIRAFPGRGIRVWGARTLSSNGAWRYVNVRRLFITVEASIDVGLQWVVFEPNDSTLWAKVRRDVSSFLRIVWRNGALFGNTPEQAFYVKCDEELNPPEVRDLGQLIIEVGLAPVKPAEFVIFRITQWAGLSAEA